MRGKRPAADLTFLTAGNLDGGRSFTVKACEQVTFIERGGVLVKRRAEGSERIYEYIPPEYRLILIERTKDND